MNVQKSLYFHQGRQNHKCNFSCHRSVMPFCKTQKCRRSSGNISNLSLSRVLTLFCKPVSQSFQKTIRSLEEHYQRPWLISRILYKTKAVHYHWGFTRAAANYLGNMMRAFMMTNRPTDMCQVHQYAHTCVCVGVCVCVHARTLQIHAYQHAKNTRAQTKQSRRRLCA